MRDPYGYFEGMAAHEDALDDARSEALDSVIEDAKNGDKIAQETLARRARRNPWAEDSSS